MSRTRLWIGLRVVVGAGGEVEGAVGGVAAASRGAAMVAEG